MTPETLVSIEGAVGTLTFSNPSRRNALTFAMIEQAAVGVARLAADPAVRVVVLRGQGEQAFISGADISGLSSHDDPQAPWRLFVDALLAVDKPVVAALRGWCLGGGVWVALAADVRIATEDARIGIPAAKLGIAYPPDAVHLLVALVGPGIAAELLMGAAPVDARRAHQVGFVNQVVDDLEAGVEAVTHQLIACSPLSQAAAKAAIAAAVRAEPARVEEAARAALLCLRSADLVEGQAAFAQKRPPQWSGH
jgi:enoyl-CoA hydratase